MLVVAVLIAVALASFGLLLVLVVGLNRHVKLLAASLAGLQKEMQPLLEEIQQGSLKARERADDFASRRRRDSSNGRSSPDLGAKLRS